MCPICNNTLTPIVKGYLSSDMLDKVRSGEVIIGEGASAYCHRCEEAFD